jgi:hypothetical protein
MTPNVRWCLSVVVCATSIACSSGAGSHSAPTTRRAIARRVSAPTPATTAPTAPAPTPIPTPIPTPVVAPGPRILSYSIGATVVHPGQTLAGTIHTTPDVTHVVLHVFGLSMPMRKTASGTFSLSWIVPDLPALFRRTYTLTAVAVDARGATAQESVPVTIQ